MHREDAPAVAFPGQGVARDQCVEVLGKHADSGLVRELRAAVGIADLAELDMRDTRVAQPAVYVAGLLNATTTFPRPDAVPMTFGHSLGEITALAFAGAIDGQQGLALTIERGSVCSRANSMRPGAMVGLMRLARIDVEWVRRSVIAQTNLSLEVAAFNSPGQVVLSGDVEAVREAIRISSGLGGVARELPIGGAFHSPVLAAVLDDWEEAVDKTRIGVPRVPTVSCIDAELCKTPEDVKRSLVRAILLPVRWESVMAAAQAFGVRDVWDAGPGQTLRKIGLRQNVVNFVDAPLQDQSAAVTSAPTERRGGDPR
jgi:[acyl-carrier-protein] S-malonyltransferase